MGIPRNRFFLTFRTKIQQYTSNQEPFCRPSGHPRAARRSFVQKKMTGHLYYLTHILKRGRVGHFQAEKKLFPLVTFQRRSPSPGFWVAYHIYNKLATWNGHVAETMPTMQGRPCLHPLEVTTGSPLAYTTIFTPKPQPKRPKRLGEG